MSDRLNYNDREERAIVALGGLLEIQAQDVRDRQKAEKEKRNEFAGTMRATLKRLDDPDNGGLYKLRRSRPMMAKKKGVRRPEALVKGIKYFMGEERMELRFVSTGLMRKLP